MTPDKMTLWNDHPLPGVQTPVDGLKDTVAPAGPSHVFVADVLPAQGKFISNWTFLESLILFIVNLANSKFS